MDRSDIEVVVQDGFEVIPSLTPQGIHRIGSGGFQGMIPHRKQRQR